MRLLSQLRKRLTCETHENCWENPAFDDVSDKRSLLYVNTARKKGHTISENMRLESLGVLQTTRDASGENVTKIQLMQARPIQRISQKDAMWESPLLAISALNFEGCCKWTCFNGACRCSLISSSHFRRPGWRRFACRRSRSPVVSKSAAGSKRSDLHFFMLIHIHFTS